jgi:hypothetical protein
MMRIADVELREGQEVLFSGPTLNLGAWILEDEEHPSSPEMREMLLANPRDSMSAIITLDCRRVLALLSDSSGST